MDEQDKKIFEEIKKKAKKDTEIWNKAQEEGSCTTLSPEMEDVIMERMFLVYYTEKYLEQYEQIVRNVNNEKTIDKEESQSFVK